MLSKNRLRWITALIILLLVVGGIFFVVLTQLNQQIRVDWTPVEQDFDGVTMVLVPSGCFMMGREDVSYGVPDEDPVHEQCLDQPFWIDKYEVTQAQFSRLGGTQEVSPRFPGDDRPVENVTWFEARDFCQLRDSRLPTEAEWEYAARGPNAWLYPWGNEFIADNVINYTNTTADVGSRPSGASWVGALDMSGNVWEWTSSLYEDYPYDATDGREADTGSDIDIFRALRGGSWRYFDTADHLTTASRDRYEPNLWSSRDGFRCVRAYEGLNSAGSDFRLATPIPSNP